MKKQIMRVLITSGLILNTSLAEARTIEYPKFNGRRIDACVINMGCGQSSITYAANAFCRQIGYRRSGYWETKTYRRRKRKDAWQLEYRRSGNIWVSRKSGHAFTRIDCYN